MKLLLTSGGITNPSIANAFLKLIGKPAEETNLAFIPTAANSEDGDKSWLIRDLNNLKNMNFKTIDIVDISALPQELWLPRLESADVLFFSGGNTTHLMYWLKKSGLEAILPDLLKIRVYAGISAGSIVAGPSLALSSKDKKLYYEQRLGYKTEEALGFVKLHVRPHLNSPSFPHARKENIEAIAKTVNEPIYALDDQSALSIVDGKVEVVSEGEYYVFNQ